MTWFSRVTSCVLISFIFIGCSSNSKENVDESLPKKSQPEKRFKMLGAKESGIEFKNTITESPKANYWNYEYFYNGGGVAIGDINNDGLSDIYFTGNMEPDRLYLNKGDLIFEDITDAAIGSAIDGWHSGVAMADVNSDGYLDIYVCRAGWYDDVEKLSNLLYINNGNMTFTESAEAYGLADQGRSTQSVFFDFDGDEDVDIYVLNAPLLTDGDFNSLEIEKMIDNKTSITDRLYRNDEGKFTDVTDQAGVRNFSYGLGAGVGDVNQDGLPDLFVSNDYIGPDNLYINQGDGTFKDEVRTMTGHISNNGMGNDIADFNNDGFVDIIEVDMVSPEHTRSKKNMAGMSSEEFWSAVHVGYHYQYMTNTLQLNNGNGTFGEIGHLAGVAKTDWSWAPLFADFDNDGDKDLFISNGLKRDMGDNDYVSFLEEIKKVTRNPKITLLLSKAPTTKLKNYMFDNLGGLSFENVADSWGLGEALNSNGAAYGDLDNDGDLDLVLNNVDDYSCVYENQTDKIDNKNSLRIKLEGDFATVLGSKIRVTTDSGEQFQEFYTSRGFQSSVEPVMHFGLGDETVAKSVSVTWPNGSYTEMSNVNAGSISINQNNSGSTPSPVNIDRAFAKNKKAHGLNFEHKENTYNDFAFETLLPHKQSEFGPFMSQGDVNGDGLSDVFIGGAIGQSGALYVQSTNGRFSKSSSQPWSGHREREDLGSELFDADGDGDLDLYVTSGSNEFLKSPELDDRLYLNNGTGKFSYSSDALPIGFGFSTQVVKSGDVDGDGDLDLFVGGRTTPRVYPFPPKSHLLINNDGKFTDETSTRAPQLVKLGMVTDAEFLDLDKDGDLDLIAVGEWMNPKVFENRGGTFKDQSDLWGTDGLIGWWNSIDYGDFDNDGDIDLVAGNLGWNSKFHGSPNHPFQVYLADFDDNGKPDIVLAKDQGNVIYPVRGRECSSEQMPFIKEKFPDFDGFAKASLFEIYDQNKLANSIQYSATQMRSSVLLNEGGTFKKVDLPERAQISPIQDIIVKDLNEDGNLDLIVAGNMHGTEVETVRQDAGDGLLLLGNGDGTFNATPGHQSGLHASGDVKDLLLVETKNGEVLFVARNNTSVQSYSLE
ncbi:MAG: hypothetical protein ACI85F_001113 [Bacteroidia bacterium]|jgi:hypothetical protein